MRKVKAHPNILREVFNKREDRTSQLEAIKRVVEDKVEARKVIDSAKSIAQDLEALAVPSVKERDVRMVMKEELGMRFRKIKTVSLHSNSEKNLVLRQRWALEFLTQARKKRVFLNVDETWLGMSDFRRMKW